MVVVKQRFYDSVAASDAIIFRGKAPKEPLGKFSLKTVSVSAKSSRVLIGRKSRLGKEITHLKRPELKLE